MDVHVPLKIYGFKENAQNKDYKKGKHIRNNISKYKDSEENTAKMDKNRKGH